MQHHGKTLRALEDLMGPVDLTCLYELQSERVCYVYRDTHPESKEALYPVVHKVLNVQSALQRSEVVDSLRPIWQSHLHRSVPGKETHNGFSGLLGKAVETPVQAQPGGRTDGRCDVFFARGKMGSLWQRRRAPVHALRCDIPADIAVWQEQIRFCGPVAALTESIAYGTSATQPEDVQRCSHRCSQVSRERCAHHEQDGA